ncbi:MAG: DapF [Armatimonadetes bacterium]|jgi:diaminopimelate epimerase|nr:DapF [Armatimonadota bacterium]
MRFTKMHGLGNDFVMVDCFEEHLDEAALPELARRACDRHFGVGADGVILAMPSDHADFRMRLINGDGSEAEHCGNGIRCMAKLVYDRGHTRSERITVETIGRVNVLDLHATDGRVHTVRVDMSEPVFRRGSLPMTGDPDAEAVSVPITVAGQTLEFTCISMGNPHAVAFVDDVQAFPVEQLGPLVERHELFPRRTNVEFIQVLGRNELDMRVWERGAGITLACGTGACASLVAAVRTGRADREAVVHLPGGDLQIEWAEDGHVYMTGPAVTVFEGEL